jgi:hypothetical protein
VRRRCRKCSRRISKMGKVGACDEGEACTCFGASLLRDPAQRAVSPHSVRNSFQNVTHEAAGRPLGRRCPQERAARG